MVYDGSMPKLTAVLTISAKQRRSLEAWVRAPNTPQGVVLGDQITLLAADGKSNSETARELGVTGPSAILWRERFLREGVLKGSPRSQPAGGGG